MQHGPPSPDDDISLWRQCLVQGVELWGYDDVALYTGRRIQSLRKALKARTDRAARGVELPDAIPEPLFYKPGRSHRQPQWAADVIRRWAEESGKVTPGTCVVIPPASSR